MYFIKKKKLSRRTFIKSSSIAIALPFLDAMIPAMAKAQASSPPLRVAYLYFPHGIHPRLNPWKASQIGTQFTFPKGLSGTKLVNFREDLLLMGGLRNHWSQYNIYGDAGNDHAAACASYLTGARMNWRSKTPSFTLSTQNANQGPFAPTSSLQSVDVLIANYLKGQKSNPLIYLTPSGFAPFDSGTADYDTDYRTYLSWQTSTTPSPRFSNPSVFFKELFGGLPGETTPNPNSKMSRVDKKKSILDSVIIEANRLSQQLGSLDKIKIDEYLTSIRQVEQSLQTEDPVPSTESPQSCQNSTEPRSNFSFPDATKANLDLIVLAFQCDQTRVVSYLMDYELNNRRYDFAGANQFDSHQASHGNFSDNYTDAFKINDWFANQFAYLIGKMKNTEDVFGPLLENSILHLGSGSNTTGGDHPDSDIPLIIAGQGGGKITTGRALNLNATRLENYHLSLMQKLNMNISKFGGSDGVISDF